jgi:ammonium transporter Rh
MFWPSFNFGVFAVTPFTKTQIVSNTILSLTGSCLATFMTSAFLKNKITKEHLLNATLPGGVVIGALAEILFNPGGALAIGFLTGIISILGYQYFTPYLEQKLGLYDTCGVHNLHVIPGILGGFVSVIVPASYARSSTLDVFTPDLSNFPQLSTLLATPYKQGGLQIATTFCSLGIGIGTAIITGFILTSIYSSNVEEFFNDIIYFEEAQ